MNTLTSKAFPNFRILPPHIKVLYLIVFLSETYLIIPIWMFFYLRYLTYEQIALITIIQQVTALILEVPTGAFADLFGKKVTLIISYVLYTASLLFMPFGTVFSYFVALEILKGTAKALYSGAFEALTYDTLVDAGREVDYPQISADFITVSWIGYIIAGITGGILYDIWFGLPYIVLGVFYLVVIFLLVLYAKEPHRDTTKVTVKAYLDQNSNGIKELFKNSRMALITLSLAVITLGYYTASELLGISQGKQYGLTGTHVGLLFTLGYIFSVIFSNLFPRLLKKYTVNPIIMATTGALLTSFILAYFVNPFTGAALIVLRISSSSTFSNARSVILNRNISSKNRSTALSSFSLLYELGYVGIAYFAGKFIGTHTPNEFALLLGILLTVVLLIQLIIYGCVNLHTKNQRKS